MSTIPIASSPRVALVFKKQVDYLSNETGTFTMTAQGISWQQDGIDTGWFVSKDIGSVRSSTSYRPGGWWFLAKWLPDAAEHDIGPFKTKAAATSEAERLAAQR